jgi:NADPH2:quinone reductase
MEAVVVRRFGGPEVLEIADVPVPQPAEGQVRIRVQAAAVNPVDIATRAGWLADSGLMAANSQIGIGWDLAGVVTEVGPEVDQFSIGDPVIGIRPHRQPRDRGSARPIPRSRRRAGRSAPRNASPRRCP